MRGWFRGRKRVNSGRVVGAVQGAIESLESRQMLSLPGPYQMPGEQINVQGTAGDDIITVVGTRSSGMSFLSDITVLGISPEPQVFHNVWSLSVYALGGNDTVRIEASVSCWVYGGDGDDYLIATGRCDGFSGGAGSDTLIGSSNNEQFYPGPGSNLVDGGDGSDEYVLSSATGPAVIRLDLNAAPQNGFGGSDIIQNIERVNAESEYDDLIVGNDQDNELRTFLGRDTIIGGGGDDHLVAHLGTHLLLAGEGNDRIFSGHESVDVIVPGPGADTIELFGDDGNIVIDDAEDQIILTPLPNLAPARLASSPVGAVLPPNPTPDELSAAGFVRVSWNDQQVWAKRGEWLVEFAEPLDPEARARARAAGIELKLQPYQNDARPDKDQWWIVGFAGRPRQLEVAMRKAAPVALVEPNDAGLAAALAQLGPAGPQQPARPTGEELRASGVVLMEWQGQLRFVHAGQWIVCFQAALTAESHQLAAAMRLELTPVPDGTEGERFLLGSAASWRSLVTMLCHLSTAREVSPRGLVFADGTTPGGPIRPETVAPAADRQRITWKGKRIVVRPDEWVVRLDLRKPASADARRGKGMAASPLRVPTAVAALKRIRPYGEVVRSSGDKRTLLLRLHKDVGWRELKLALKQMGVLKSIRPRLVK